MGLETFFFTFLDIILHLDIYLQAIIDTYHLWTYAFLFLVIFCETGLIFTPFLPGDSLLFAAGAFAAIGSLNIAFVLLIIFVAAVLGDFVNFKVGKHLGPRIFKKEKSLLFNKEYLVHTEQFYEKHGKKTIIAARFIPIIRTFAPFVAGIGKMNPLTFAFYNIIGAVAWCGLFIWGGYFFGNIPIVKEHFNWVIIGIVVISFIPVVKEIIHGWLKKKYPTQEVK
ncbi:MAG TPA: DedA family protein [Candidatus Nanoarchaeia archaeon]|nr:DedA family protein [Candidatus Nanoarchaeia archaeon]